MNIFAIFLFLIVVYLAQAQIASSADSLKYVKQVDTDKDGTISIEEHEVFFRKHFVHEETA
jgi:hypothetical protein